MVEELLRWESPVMIVPRVATRDTEVAGCPIAAGETVLAMIGSANTDEDYSPDAHEVRWNRPRNLSVSDVLAAAGVSTRSFYRHFESKEALLIAVMRRDAEAVGDLLDHAVADAPNSAAAVHAWLDGYLSCFYEPKRARRTTLYASPGANASPAVVAEHAALHQILARSLTKALRTGHRAGVLSSPNPRDDAMTVLALVSVAVNQRGDERSRRTRHATRHHVMRFAWPALGLALV